jgi:hypothetical protein
MSPKALVPINVPARSSAPTVPTLQTGDLYYNTSTGLMVYDGTNWQAVSTTSALTEIDAGVFDGTSPYQGGSPSTTATQTVNGGTP